MRKITKEAAAAFEANKEFNRDNTKVSIVNKGTEAWVEYKLYETVIASKKLDSKIVYVKTGGHNTNTTKDRLNGIDGINIVQKDGKWHLNGHAWSGVVTGVVV